jgi:hypothetical protein
MLYNLLCTPLLLLVTAVVLLQCVPEVVGHISQFLPYGLEQVSFLWTDRFTGWVPTVVCPNNFTRQLTEIALFLLSQIGRLEPVVASLFG